MRHQRRHRRVSKLGRPFVAGSRFKSMPYNRHSKIMYRSETKDFVGINRTDNRFSWIGTQDMAEARYGNKVGVARRNPKQWVDV